MRARSIVLTLALALVAGCSDDGGGVTEPDASETGAAEDVADEAPSCVAEAPALSTGRLTIEGVHLIDALDRQVILRGVNAGGRSKLPPFFPFPFAESGHELQGDAPPFVEALAAYYDRMASWGTNIVRMPFSWEALEPERGTYDAEWAERYVAQIEAAQARGMRVIVDFHQDVFARPYCGDGFPIWACPEPVPEAPEDCSQWFLGYFSDPAQMAAFDGFWANTDGVRDDFSAMWEHMVGLTWHLDNVIGYEIINEPGNGSADEATWGPEVLTPFYTEVGAAIRGWAPEALVFFDGTGIDAVTQETHIERPEGEGFVFAPHFYDGNVFIGGDIGGQEYVVEGLGKWVALRESWDVPALVGEFGIQPAHPSAADYIRFNYDVMDETLLHGTLWEYSSTEDDWNDEAMSMVDPTGEETVVVGAMVRAYPAAVAGRIDTWSYDPDARTGALSFQAQAAGVTELVVPARVYPEGVTAELSGVDGCWAHDDAAGRLFVRTTEAGAATVTLAPAGE